MNITPENIYRLALNEIFVFGSNLAGRHGKGAALLARDQFGAKQGVGQGFTGRCYAIATKDGELRRLALAEIAPQITRFLAFAERQSDFNFLVTKIGCGLAGYTPAQIAPLFFRHVIPNNVYLPKSFWDYHPNEQLQLRQT